MFGPLGLAALVILTLVLVALLRFVRTRPGFRRASLDRFARRVGLAMPDELRPRAEAALLSRNLAVDVGSAAGILVLALAAGMIGGGEVTRADDGPLRALWPLIVIGSALAGAAIGAAVSGARQARRRTTGDGPRVARAHAPAYGDYVAPLELWGGRLAAVAPAALLLLGLATSVVSGVMTTSELVTTWAVVAVVVPLVTLGVSEIAGRRLLELPQTAGSSLELAWNDAVRARLLRDIVTAPLAIGVYATFALLVIAGESIRNDIVAEVVIALIGLGSALAVVVIAIVSAADRPHRHFRRQLWPDQVAAGAGPDATGGPPPMGGTGR